MAWYLSPPDQRFLLMACRRVTCNVPFSNICSIMVRKDDGSEREVSLKHLHICIHLDVQLCAVCTPIGYLSNSLSGLPVLHDAFIDLGDPTKFWSDFSHSLRPGVYLQHAFSATGGSIDQAVLCHRRSRVPSKLRQPQTEFSCCPRHDPILDDLSCHVLVSRP